jgi:hypothetical protein
MVAELAKVASVVVVVVMMVERLRLSAPSPGSQKPDVFATGSTLLGSP